jgi:hypothetical protein
MRAVIVGLDFVYDSIGNLRPIEMNTNIGYSTQKVENDNEVFDMTDFQNFLTSNMFTKITYIGANVKIKEQIQNVATNLSLEFETIVTTPNSITVPYIEDSATHLIVRTAFDTTAILDSSYCKNKIAYLNLIKDSEFGSEFAYLNEENVLINNITNIQDNGIHPNFILKAVAPNYDKEVYPKFYKVTNQTELDIVLQNVTKDYFLMPYYFNESKSYSDKVTKIRKISMLFPPNLESIHIGAYTDISIQKLQNTVNYSEETFEIDDIYRKIYYTSDFKINLPKLLDDDYVIMADGTTKSGLDLQVGDLLRTIDIPNADNIDAVNVLANYQIDMQTFLDGVVYSTNRVTSKNRIDITVEIAEITFTDGTKWFDTINSSYLIYENNEIKFVKIMDFVSGNVVLLIDTSEYENVQIVEKIVQSINIIDEEFSGWTIGVERAHLFLTSTGNPTNPTVSYVSYFAAVEHNNASCFGTPYYGQGSCPKGFCCGPFAVCEACVV